MTKRRQLLLLPLVLVVSACVTINIYFPAAAAEEAADRIIRDVWGEEGPGKDNGGQPAEGAEDAQGSLEPVHSGVRVGLLQLLEAVVPAAHAAEADIDISTPAISRIQASMRQRHGELEPFYASGAIGLTNAAEVAVREPGAVPLKDRSRLNRLVADENRDRAALYREIARANGHPEWEDDIRAAFARRWAENARRRGWWYQDPQGRWQR